MVGFEGLVVWSMESTLMMHARRVLLAALFGLTSPAVLAQIPLFEAQKQTHEPKFAMEFRVWFPDIDGDIKAKKNGIGEKLDLNNDLGLDDGDLSLGGRVYFRLAERSKLRLGYQQLEFDGDNTGSGSIAFDGTNFDLTAGIDSKINLGLWEMDWILESDANKGLRWIFSTGFEVYDWENKVSGVNTMGNPASQKVSEVLFLPNLGMGVGFQIASWLDVYAEAKGMYLFSIGSYVDSEGGLKLNIGRNLSVTGGYRYILLNADYGDFDGDFTIQGVFASATLLF